MRLNDVAPKYKIASPFGIEKIQLAYFVFKVKNTLPNRVVWGNSATKLLKFYL